METFIPRMELSSVDLPAFGRPTMAIKPAFDIESTYCLNCRACGVLFGFFFRASHGNRKSFAIHPHFDFKGLGVVRAVGSEQMVSRGDFPARLHDFLQLSFVV